MSRYLSPLLAFLMIAGSVLPVASEPKSPTEGGAKLCKDKCQKDCMGNDTPTERSDCLKREKCEDRPACPAGSSTGTMQLDKGGATPKPPKAQLPKGNTGGVLQQQ